MVYSNSDKSKINLLIASLLTKFHPFMINIRKSSIEVLSRKIKNIPIKHLYRELSRKIS